jgi:hypothetical protein
MPRRAREGVRVVAPVIDDEAPGSWRFKRGRGGQATVPAVRVKVSDSGGILMAGGLKIRSEYGPRVSQTRH